MTGIDYGPLNNASEVNSRYKNYHAKDHQAQTVRYRGKLYTVSKAYAKEFSRQQTQEEEKIPLKYRRQAATMEVSKGVAKGSFQGAKEFADAEGLGYIMPFTLLLVSLPATIVGTIALGIQKISEAQFGKTIDIAGNKMNRESYLDYINHLSKSRIDKNFKRGVIDEETSNILKALKVMIGEVRTQKSELRHQESEKRKLDHKLQRLETKEKPLVELLRISPDDLKAKAALKTITTEKKAVEELIGKNQKQIEAINKEIARIQNDSSEKIKGFQAKKDVKLQKIDNVSNALIVEEAKLKSIRNQHKQDKKVLYLEKNINKKYKSADGHVNVQNFFEDKYKAYLKNCIKHEKPPLTKNEFIKKYYSKKGIYS